MAERRVEFRLSMPSPPSWNGRWSGEDGNHTLVRDLSEEDMRRIGVPGSWSWHWSDGWTAVVDARVVPVGEKLAKSGGFQGYDWMVDSIVRYGRIMDDQAKAAYLASLEAQVQPSDADRLAYIHPRRLRECIEHGHDWRPPASGHGAVQCARCGMLGAQHREGE